MPEPETNTSSILQNNTSQKAAMPENFHVSIGRWVFRIVIVAAILALLVYAFVFQGKNLPKTPSPITGQNLQAYQMNVLPQGREPEGFPSSVILEPRVQIFYSEDSIDSTGVNQKIIMFYSTSTPDSLFKTYSQVLPKDKWVLNNSVDQKDVKLLEFLKVNILRVLITPHLSGSQVRLEYHVVKQ